MKRVNKSDILKLLYARFDRKISREVINNVVSLFLAEFNEELKEKKEIKIGNFCSFTLAETPIQRYHDIRDKRLHLSRSRKILKLKLNKKLRKRIVKHLNILKTFNL